MSGEEVKPGAAASRQIACSSCGQSFLIDAGALPPDICPICKAILSMEGTSPAALHETRDGPSGSRAGRDGLKMARCPRCRMEIEFAREHAGKIVECPSCRASLRVSRKAFAQEDAREREHRAQARSAEAERRRLLRREGMALAQPQWRKAARSALRASGKIIGAAGVVCLLVCWWGSVEPARAFIPGGIIGGSAALLVGLATLGRRMPWYILSPEATARAVERRRQEQAELQRRLQEEKEARRQAEEEERRRQEAEAEAKLLAEEQRQKRLADGGCEECWRHLDWYDFEIGVLLAFEHAGHKAKPTHPGIEGDGGIDGWLQDEEGQTNGVQCKRWSTSRTVEVDTVRAFRGALSRDGVSCGFFVATTDYSAACQREAAVETPTAASVRLLGIEELTRMGQGLSLTPDVIGEAKRRWGAPERPPPEMERSRLRSTRPRRYRRW